MIYEEPMNEGIPKEGISEEIQQEEIDQIDGQEVFRGDSDDDDEESTEKPVGERIKVAIDWVEFEGALENNSPELHSFLNRVTGDVIRVFENGENSDLRLKEAESSDDYIYIDPISSREQYRWMEEFIEMIEEPTLKDKLNIAIDGKGAFRRFKDVLVAYPNERELWFAKRSAKLRGHMAEWLESKNVEPTNTPPWEGDASSNRTDEARRPRIGDESRGWRDGPSDLRSVAHDMLDLVPSRELPTALAFLEFLRGRRGGYRRSRFG